MSKALRLPEKWFRRGLGLVAIVFAGFLIGLGRTIVGDLPRVEKPLQLEDYMDRVAADHLRTQIQQAQVTIRDAQADLDQARLKRRIAEADTQAARVQQLQQRTLDAQQAQERAQRVLAQMETEAQKKLDAEARRLELRVFLYRLAITLPPLVIAGWLLKTQRKSTWWPFAWGFAISAVFAFFVELVPYLPSYGGSCATSSASSRRCWWDGRRSCR